MDWASWQSELPIPVQSINHEVGFGKVTQQLQCPFQRNPETERDERRPLPLPRRTQRESRTNRHADSTLNQPHRHLFLHVRGLVVVVVIVVAANVDSSGKPNHDGNDKDDEETNDEDDCCGGTFPQRSRVHGNQSDSVRSTP